MTEVTVDAVLERAAQLLRDPDRVVKAAGNLFEDAEGMSTWDADKASRCCFMGSFRLAAFQLTGGDDRGLADLAEERVYGQMTEGRYGFSAWLIEEGPEACADLIDKARVAA